MEFQPASSAACWTLTSRSSSLEVSIWVPQVRHLLTGRPNNRFQVFPGLDVGNKGFHESGKAGGQFMGRLVRLAPDAGGNPVDLVNVLQRFFLRAACTRDSRSRSSISSVPAPVPNVGGW